MICLTIVANRVAHIEEVTDPPEVFRPVKQFSLHNGGARLQRMSSAKRPTSPVIFDSSRQRNKCAVEDDITKSAGEYCASPSVNTDEQHCHRH